MNILYTAFNGKNNSSKILLDNIMADNKIYLVNSFTTSVKQLEKEIKNNEYDLIISFGQAELEKDNIRIEIIGKNENTTFETNYDFYELKKELEKQYKVEISNDAGNYLCNNIYYNGLKIISENDLKSKMIFIHIPKIEKIEDINKMAKLFLKLR